MISGFIWGALAFLIVAVEGVAPGGSYLAAWPLAFGSLGLVQMHPGLPMKVQFRNLRIKLLDY